MENPFKLFHGRLEFCIMMHKRRILNIAYHWYHSALNGVHIIWNGIDFDERNAPNVQSFKTRYKHVYFKK